MDDKDLHHTSQLRANSERAPLNSPSVSGHRLLCASLLVFSYLPLGQCCCCRRRLSRFVFSSAQTPLSGAAPLFSSAAALLFCCAWKRRWCVSSAAGGTKFVARTAIPPRCCGYRATVDFVDFLLIGISKAVVLLGLRLRSPPVASGRLRSPPVASVRSPPVTSSRPPSPSTNAMGLGLVQVVPGGVSVGRGALFQCTNAFWGLNQRSQGVTSSEDA